MGELALGDRIGVVEGAMVGYYGHISDFVLSTSQFMKRTGVAVVLQGNSRGEANPKWVGVECFLPIGFVEHVD